MKYLCVPEKYESNGEEKVSWKRIGETFVGKNGKQYVKLYHMPGTLIHVYEEKKQESKQAKYDEFGADNDVNF